MQTRYSHSRKRTRRVGLLALGIASLLSPAGMIVASSIVVATVVGGVVSLSNHTPASNKESPVAPGSALPGAPAPAAARAYASGEITHIDMDGSPLPVMLTDASDAIAGHPGASGPGYMPPSLFNAPPAPQGHRTPSQSPPPSPLGAPPGPAFPSSLAPTTPDHPQPPVTHPGGPSPSQPGAPDTPPIPGGPDLPPASLPPTLTGDLPPTTDGKTPGFPGSDPAGGMPPDTQDDSAPLQNDRSGPIAAVPEPSTLGLTLLGLLGLAWAGRRTAARAYHA